MKRKNNFTDAMFLMEMRKERNKSFMSAKEARQNRIKRQKNKLNICNLHTNE